MKKMLQRGFTLIELLVVIAIIGILAAVVLASLNDARSSASDASAKGSMTSVRNQAELYYNENGYAYDADNTNDDDGVCLASGDVGLLITAATDAGATGAICNENNTAYAAQVTLQNGDFFCVDSTGFAGEPTATVGTATACP